MGYIEGENRHQIILFPESMDDYISENNPVRVIDEYVDQLDVAELGLSVNKFSSIRSILQNGLPMYIIFMESK